MILQVTRIIISLLLVTGLAVYFLRTGVFRKLLTQSDTIHRLKIDERLKVSAKTELVLISIDGKNILLGVSDSQLNLYPGVLSENMNTDESELSENILSKKVKS